VNTKNELQVVNNEKDFFIAPVVSVEAALQAWQAKKDFIKKVLKPNIDYGIIPGTSKNTLLKPGAEKMAAFFGFSSVFSDVEVIEDWTGKEHDGEPFFYYRQKCTLYRGDLLIASADGSCNSWEKKYRYRKQERECPSCGKNAIIKGREEYGGGWLCYKRKDGCGAKFQDHDEAIISQDVGVVKNPEISDIVNTILKMAQKRALVAAVLIATNVSDYFTQDIEDYVEGTFSDLESSSVKKESRTERKPATTKKPSKRETEKPTGPVGWLLEWGVDHVKHAANLATKLQLSTNDKEGAEKRYSTYCDLKASGKDSDEAAKLVLAEKE